MGSETDTWKAENVLDTIRLEDTQSAQSFEFPSAVSALHGNSKQLKQIRRRLDFRLTAMLAVLYICAFLDRANLANANIAGMGNALKLSIGNRYSVITMIFFVGYSIIEIPATMMVRKLSPTKTLPTFVLCFGVITIGQGFLQGWGELLVCRILLGLFEGAFLPGAVFVMQMYYARFEFQKRIALFYMVVIAASGLSGLLAYGIEKMDGTSSLDGWRWIFILEGVATCAVALVAYVVLVDFPDQATRPNFVTRRAFLNEDDKAALMAYIEQDRGQTASEEFGWRRMLRHLLEWECWEYASFVVINNTGLYAFNFFLPIILSQGFGYSAGRANLLTFPPFAAALPWMYIVSWFNDKFHTRGPSMVLNSVLYIVGVSIVAFLKTSSTRYGGVFLGALGIAGNIPTQTAYQHSNMLGHSKRALTLCLMTMGGAVGGIIAGNIFRAQDAPTYTPAICTCIAIQVSNPSRVKSKL
ncbi:hypothetical protein CLAIMM_05747 [Cladophialophora immunda]|nr:hypothetical protein CLAIMM_05747 [Cladophialophora immunda]